MDLPVSFNSVFTIPPFIIDRMWRRKCELTSSIIIITASKCKPISFLILRIESRLKKGKKFFFSLNFRFILKKFLSA